MDALSILAVEISTENMAIIILLGGITALASVVTYLYLKREKDFEELKQILKDREADIEMLYGKLLEVHYKRPDVLSSSEIPQFPNSNAGAEKK